MLTTKVDIGTQIPKEYDPTYQEYKKVEPITKNRILIRTSIADDDPSKKMINHYEDHILIQYTDFDDKVFHSSPVTIRSYIEKNDNKIDNEKHIETHLNIDRYKENDQYYDYYEYIKIKRYFDTNENKVIEEVQEFDAYTNSKNIEKKIETKIEKNETRVEVLKIVKKRKMFGYRRVKCHDYDRITITYNTFERIQLVDKNGITVHTGEWVLRDTNKEEKRIYDNI